MDSDSDDICSDTEVLEWDGTFDSEDGDEDDDNIESIITYIKNNDPCVEHLQIYDEGLDGDYFDSFDYVYAQNMTLSEWEDLGRGIAHNTHLKEISLCDGLLDDEIMSSLFSGLTRSNTVAEVCLYKNDLSAAGMRSMVPFIKNATKLKVLSVDYNYIQSEGLSLLLRALRNSAIENLHCHYNDIESIEDEFPKTLKSLALSSNNIGVAGCLKIAELLNGDDAVLESLDLWGSDIDDECIAILVESLRNNTSLKYMDFSHCDNISDKGRVMLLQLVNDSSSINATLQSNHTLFTIETLIQGMSVIGERIQRHIDWATERNKFCKMYPERAGRKKLIETQLYSICRAELAKLQGIGRSFYSEIPPILLPDVYSLIGRKNCVSQLFIALTSCIAEIVTLVDRKGCILQQRECNVDRVVAKLDVDEVEVGSEPRRNKRLRA